MNIIDAVNDPKVFAPLFRDSDSWQAWLAFLCALFGLPMTKEQRAIYRECTGREDRPTDQSKQAWLVVGRRGGKSLMLALVAVFLACFKDWREYLGPGEKGTVMVIAADRKQARVIMRFVKGLLHAVPMLKALITSERAEIVELSNNLCIEIHTCSFRSVRGYSIVAALLDEIAIWRNDEGAANVDVEVITALRPAMSTIPGSIMLCASSPYARRGVLWEAYDEHFGKVGHPLVWQAETRRMNPTVPQQEIDDALASDPARYGAEYLGKFRTDIETFVSREIVQACIESGCRERGYLRDNHYTGFVDPSGGSNDSFTLGISHREGDVAVLDCLREVRPPFSPEAVISEFADVLKRYKIRRVTGDRYGGEFPRELFRKFGIKYEPAEHTKSEIYVDILAGLNSGKVSLLENERLVRQLISLERRHHSGGKDIVDHPPKGHDDVCNAAMGACLYAARKSHDPSWAWVTGDAPPPTVRTYEEILAEEEERQRARERSVHRQREISARTGKPDRPLLKDRYKKRGRRDD